MMVFISLKRLLGMLVLITGLGAGLSVATAVPALAQSATVYSKITVQGNQRIESASILNFAGLESGAELSGGQINAAYQRLQASGLFEEVSITPKGSTLIITVREYPTINEIVFEGNKKLKEDKLLAVIKSEPRHTYSPAQAEADVKEIVAAYRQAGRFNASVKAQIIRRSDNRVDLVFEVFEGKVVEIQRLSFVGNRNYSDARLRGVLGTKQAGILRQLIRSDTFVADRIEFDKQVLRDFYQSRGYIDFEIQSVTTEIARSGNGFFVTFTVREGQSYRFGKVTTSSDLKEIDPDLYQETVRIKAGSVYSPVHVDKAIERMERLATQEGLAFIRVSPRVTRNDENRTLDIDFVVEKGPRIFVERIDIEGNSTTIDRVIRRQFQTVEGDPLNPRQIRDSAGRIRALGFFSISDVTTRPGSGPDRVIVDVDVEEQPTGSFVFGLSYSASAGTGGSISLTESNFLGRGQYLRFDLTAGADSRNFELTFAEPAFLDRDLRLEFSTYYNTATQQSAFYNTTELGIAPGIGFPLSPNGRLKLNFRASEVAISNVADESSDRIKAENDSKVRVTGLKATYSFDSRYTGLNPTAGTVFRFSQEIGAGTTNFSKTTAMFGAQTTLANDEVVLKAEFEGGVLVATSGTTSITERFFMGQNIMRGYQRNGIGPRDNAATNEDALGGTNFAVARLEASFPIGLPEEYGIAGGLFMDVGSLWGLDGSVVGIDSVNMIPRSVLGATVFWDTAIGPLRFNFTKVMSGPSYDKPEDFTLTIGRRF